MDRRTKLIVMTVTIFLVLFILIVAWGFADDGGLDAWVICQPGQFVYLYEEPSGPRRPQAGAGLRTGSGSTERIRTDTRTATGAGSASGAS